MLRILKNNGRFYIADEKLENGHTHGDGPNSDPARIKLLLLDSGFVNISLSNHRHGNEEMYFFSMIKKWKPSELPSQDQNECDPDNI